MTVCGSVTDPGVDVKVASAQPIPNDDVDEPRAGVLGVFRASPALDSGTDVSNIPEPVLRQLEARLPDIQFWMPLEEHSRNMKLANGHIAAVTFDTVALQLTIDSPRGSVFLDLEVFPVMPACVLVPIFGRVTLDKSELIHDSATAFHEAEMGTLFGAMSFGKLDFLHRYWQMPLAPEVQELLLRDITPQCVYFR